MTANDNDNDTTERYTIRRYHMPRMVHCWGPHKWRVFDDKRGVSIGFATYQDAMSCVAALQYCDERWPASTAGTGRGTAPQG